MGDSFDLSGVSIQQRVLAGRAQCLFQSSFFGCGKIPPTQKNLQSPPQTAAKLCSKSFLAGAMNYKYTAETLLMDSKHRKLFVIKNQSSNSTTAHHV